MHRSDHAEDMKSSGIFFNPPISLGYRKSFLRYATQFIDKPLILIRLRNRYYMHMRDISHTRVVAPQNAIEVNPIWHLCLNFNPLLFTSFVFYYFPSRLRQDTIGRSFMVRSPAGASTTLRAALITRDAVPISP